MSDDILAGELATGVREVWVRFSDTIEPLRSDLFRFALGLTGNPFDAEDLVHDGMLRAFGTLGLGREEVRNPRAFLFRIMTNLRIDELRRARPEMEEPMKDQVMAPMAPQPGALRDAAERTFEWLTPRERAAIVLKEAFDMGHSQIAEVLSTSESAVRVALHRGRHRLAKDESSRPRRPRVSPELLDRFVDAIRAHDLDQVKALVVDDLEAKVFPEGFGVGDAEYHAKGWIAGAFYRHVPERMAREEGYPFRLEVRDVAGERAVLVFVDYGEGEALEEVWLFEESDGRVARIRDYGFCPDLVRWAADHCSVPFRAVGYRFPAGGFRDPPGERGSD